MLVPMEDQLVLKPWTELPCIAATSLIVTKLEPKEMQLEICNKMILLVKSKKLSVSIDHYFIYSHILFYYDVAMGVKQGTS
jgi:hypothetical protein